eukprot:TRINITY_DN730_c0_g1_i2.p1 TRINITY_DN730_c0_g1~~TRINITY_DN730_c0_g1_i2.p1  ORF type:complete len:224 (+),score=98.22 TRINITY_DN730_c0_g1_i2:98-769(+)
MSEEAEMEIEALEAVYGEEMEVLEPGKRIRVEVMDPNSDDPETGMRVELKAEFPATYPEDVPTMSVRGMKLLTRAQVDPLHILLKEKALEMVGEQMIYELTTFIQEWMANGAQDPEKRDGGGFEGQMVIESQKKHGTPVTVENFAEWKAAFESETATGRRKKEIKVDDKGEVKLTGRQIFDRAISTVDWELFKDGEGMEDEDLPSFDEEDEEDGEEEEEEEEE